MAVYKPSNCVPFLSCWDLTQNQYISCELNSSNELITGYKIKIFDVDNNLIFEGKEFSPIPETVRITTETQDYTINNTGLNGSTLTLPLIVVSADYSQDNVIYYNNGEWYAKEGAASVKIENFSNDDANQPYKWQIVLAQGQKMPSTGAFNQEPELKYYDMVIDESKILSSTNNRIQSYLSENIYKDYYIQLYDESNNQLGVRTRISSYDHSYGFIYPQENTIPQELVDRASYFKVFKDTNDPQYVSAARLVNYRVKNDIDKISLNGKTPSTKFTLSGDVNVVSNPYFTQIYDGDVTSFITYSAYSENGSDVLVSENSTFLVMYQGAESQRVWKRVSGTAEIQDISGLYHFSGSFEPEGVNIKNVIASVTIGKSAIASYNQDSNTINYTIYSKTKKCAAIIRYDSEGLPMPIDSGSYNANNGVFAFQSATYDSKTNQTTIKWLRPANFNTYSNFINRLICVQSETRNYSTSATAENIGTINQTELMFYPETAIGLYPVYEDGTKNLKVAEVKLANSEIGKPQDFNGGIISSVKVKTQPTGVTLTAMSLGGNKYVVKASDTYTGEAIVNITYMEDRGEVFKNTAGKAYIRPFVGIHTGDKLFYGNKFENNVTIKNIDNEPNSKNKYSPTWYIEYDSSKIFSVDEKYSIRSFFKTSDENPFYAKPSPELIIDSKQWESEGGVYQTDNGHKIGTKRYITVSGTFKNRNWVNYQWFLTDLKTGYVQQSEKIYRGSTQYTFYGLENEHYYLIQWVVEDEYDVTWTTSDEGNTFITKVIINATEFPFDVTYECETQSVLINFVRDGIVIPNPSRIEMLYYYVYPVDGNGNQIIGQERVPYKVPINKDDKEGDYYMVNSDSAADESGVVEQLPYAVTYENEHMVLTNVDEGKEFPSDRVALMEYSQTKLGETANERGSISVPTTDDCVFNSEHILNENFCGNIITYNVDVDDVSNQKAHIELTLTVPTPWYQDDSGEYVANENRNRIILSAVKKIGNLNAEVTNVPLSVYRKDKDGNWVEDNKKGRWQSDNQIASAFVNGNAKPTDNIDYLRTTHPYVTDLTGDVNKQNLDYTNINEEGAWNSAGKISQPLSGTKATQNEESPFSIWSDKELLLINQTKINETEAGNPINVYTGKYNYWHDTYENGTKYYYWHDRNDNSGELYRQTLTTEHTGRKNIGKYQMTFSILFRDYNNPNLNSGKVMAQNITARVFIEEIVRR